MHTSSIIQIEQVIHRNIHTCAFTYMRVTINEEKRGHRFERQEGHAGHFGGKKEKGEMI